MAKIHMTFSVALTGALLSWGGLPLVGYTEEVKPCVKYWVVGMAECVEPVSETTVTKQPTPTIVAPTPPPAPTLDNRIDEFLENYGKPPREFVAFHLEPTLENALAWVRVYNEKLQRNVNITEAWIQAEEIYNNNLKQGVDVTKNLPYFQENSPLMEVPDYGVPIERFKPVVPELEIYKELQKRNKENPAKQESRIGAYAANMAGGEESIDALAEKYGLTAKYDTPPSVLAAIEQIKRSEEIAEKYHTKTVKTEHSEKVSNEKRGSLSLTPQEALSGTEGNPIEETAEPVEASGHLGYDGKIKIDYYFSAKCPYCAKFEPEFQQMITQYKDWLDITCVDVTPAQRVASNILGKVDCEWRPAAPGELQQMGVRSTPSLIIRRAPGQPLERVGGYVPIAKIKAYLFGDQPK